jgi:hypothetical protein
MEMNAIHGTPMMAGTRPSQPKKRSGAKSLYDLRIFMALVAT